MKERRRLGLGSRSIRTLCQSGIHKSLCDAQTASRPLQRLSRTCITEPELAMQHLRVVLQRDISKQIELTMQKYVDNFFEPASTNAKENLGLSEEARQRLVRDCCARALDQARLALYPEIERDADEGAKRTKEEIGSSPVSGDQGGQNASSPDSVTVKKEEMDETCDQSKMFVLQSSVIAALSELPQQSMGFESLLTTCKRYALEAEDVHQLQGVVEGIVGGDNLLLLSDVCSRLNGKNKVLGKLRSFAVPDCLLRKIESSWLNRCHCSSDIRVLCHPVKDEFIDNEAEDESRIKEEHDAVDDVDSAVPSSSDDELGFLHGMNLHSLVQELELQTTAASSNDENYGLVGILAMDSDDESVDNTQLHQA